MKKLLSILLSIILIMSICPMGIFQFAAIANGNTNDFAGGSGTAEDPYLISTAEHLNNVRYYMSSHFKMINDITISNFISIGCDANYLASATFNGVFDGNGFSISGMTMAPVDSFNYYKDSYYFGLFYSVNGAVCNLHLENICLMATDHYAYSYAYVGGIAAINDGVISNCTVSGSLYVYADDTAGGIVAYNRYGTVEQCANFASISGDRKMAGIVYNNYGIVKNCYNAGGISFTASQSDHSVFGIVGDGGSHSSVSCCYNSGQLYSYNAYATRGSSTTNSYCLSSSLAGRYYNYPGSTKLLSESEMQDQNSFVGFDFENIWTMGGDPDYPYPELQCFALSGEVGVKGNVAYLSTAEVDLSKINRVDDTFKYIWFIDGQIVSTDQTYTFPSSKIGKTLKVSVTGTKKYNMGTLYSKEYVISKAIQTSLPEAPELQSLDDKSFEISTVPTQEYSIDNINWQSSGLFENLDPNKEYTVYSRIIENDLYLTGESKAVLTVKTDRRPVAGVVNISGTSRYGDTLTADTSSVGPTGVTYDYEWKANGTVIGTANTFTITQTDIGKNITVSVKGTGDYIGTLTSASVTATKTTVQLPNAPVVLEKTNTSITLVEKTGYEYSKDTIYWQDSPVFNNLSAATEYTFYQRAKETATTFASKASNGTKTTTLKNSVPAPQKPTVINITNISVTLEKTAGYEYSKDGLTWQTSNIFGDLDPFTEYSFCQRIAENDTDYASAQSGYTIVTTLKNSVIAPVAPTIATATDSAVTLTAINGYEYSKNGTTWQKSNTFSGLTVLETYSFYQRIAETETDYASPASEQTSFKVKNIASKTATPVLKENNNNKIIIETAEGTQYSIDGINWQTGDTFDNLQPNTQYSIYARTLENDAYYAGEQSDALVVTTLKNTVEKPSVPVISNKTATTVTLRSTDGFEYSKDGVNWQTSNIFDNLLPNTEYTFYQRVAESNTNYVSESSEGITVATLKNMVNKPSSPTVSNKTFDTVTLVATIGYEYSIDGTTWQSSNIFAGLSPNTKYSFYQRVAETDTSYASENSDALAVTTLKVMPYTPNAPVLVEATQTTIKLQPYAAYEYSKDGVTWQSSNAFTGLTPNTTYSFYQRVKETSNCYASEKSEVLSVKTTAKGECELFVQSPIITDYTDNTVKLYAFDGYEYSKNGTTWQKSNIFTGLAANTSYTFYQRIAATDEYFASSSKSVSQKTAKTGVTSADNFDKVMAYVESNGKLTDDGYKRIIFTQQGDGITFLYAIEKIGNGINFTVINTVESSSGYQFRNGFTLYKNSKDITTDFTMIYYYDSSPYDYVVGTKVLDRSTYNRNTSYTFGKSGKIITASVSTASYNQTLGLLMLACDNYLLYNLGFGFRQLGFINFSETGTPVCDKPSNSHYGLTEIRNSRVASCFVDGYTGDTYCATCGELIKSGSVISAYGAHLYDDAHDTDCNRCGETRTCNHTYDNDCDDTCNVCGAKRIVCHIYDDDCDETCNVCGFVRKAPHVFEGKDDLICNNCGHERPPYIPGDVNDDDTVTDADAVYLLMYTFFPEDYPVNQDCDFNHDGAVTDADAVYLLMYTFFPEDYPIN